MKMRYETMTLDQMLQEAFHKENTLALHLFKKMVEIENESYNEGKSDGFDEGYEHGYDIGYNEATGDLNERKY